MQTEVINERIRAVFDARFLARHAGSGDPDPAPIFVVGLPRSGSTLIEQILASHSHVDATHELPEVGRLILQINREQPRQGTLSRGRARFRRRGLGRSSAAPTSRRRASTGATRRASSTRTRTTLRASASLSLALPNARFINARRHPLDTCLSCYKQLFARGQPFTYDLVEIGEYYLEYDRMMAHWSAVLPGRVLDVQYEDVVADLQGQVRRMLDFCGLSWEDACLRFHETERAIRTASSEQVRRPIYDSSIGIWRHYERELAPLIDVLAPLLARYGRDSGLRLSSD